MTKRHWVVIVVLILGGLLWYGVRQTPSVQAPTGSGDTLAPEPKPATKDDLITVTAPLPKAQVSSPVTITGMARGNWYFEGSFPITLTDWDGKIIAEGYATAQGEWMTTEYVPFTATLAYTLPPDTLYRRGFLILHKDNPSGEPQFDNAIEIEVAL